MMEISWLTRESIAGSQTRGHPYFPSNHRDHVKTQAEDGQL